MGRVTIGANARTRARVGGSGTSGGGPSGPPVAASCIAQWWADDVADGAVATWPDRVGSNDLTQGTFGLRPVASGSGASRALSFDGFNDLLVLGANLWSGTQGCIVVVGKVTTPTAGTTIWSTSNTGATNRWIVGTTSTPSTGVIQIQGQNTGTRGPLNGHQAPGAGALASFEWSSTGAAWAMRLNGTSQTLSGTNHADWGTAVTGANQFVLGALQRSSGTISSLTGSIAFASAYSAPLAGTDRTDLYAWITAHYGI